MATRYRRGKSNRVGLYSVKVAWPRQLFWEPPMSSQSDTEGGKVANSDFAEDKVTELRFSGV